MEGLTKYAYIAAGGKLMRFVEYMVLFKFALKTI